MKLTIQYNTEWGESLLVVAGGERFPMTWNEGNLWSAEVPSRALKNYFYAVVRDGLVTRMEWDNHTATTHLAERGAELRDEWIDAPAGCPFPRRHSQPKFDRPHFRGAGVAVPVFSLRSCDDFGIGEFADLRHIVDWAAATGLCIIQLLPVNDTTRKGQWEDSYPYSPVSSFALNPLYINLQQIGVPATPAFLKEQAALNALPELDYPRVFKAKMKHIRKAYLNHGAQDIQTPAFKRFTAANKAWLGEYTHFCAERDGLEPEYFAWVQYHLDRQLGDVAAYARSKGVSLKGDLPIGVSADSAEARFHPELFNLDSCAGAPPDFFSADGQNWGFPTYNWEAMASDNYKWWKERLGVMSRYFDAFRIDHILGFFRIWEIPASQESGKMGHFNPELPYTPEEIAQTGLPLEGLFLPDPRHEGMLHPRITPDTSALAPWQQERFGAMYNDFFFHRHEQMWQRNAERKLPGLLSATGMLACGEDLGMVPHSVPGVMAHWGILSLEMACMDKGRPWPYMSVCATSSHDMDTLRMQHARSHEGADLPPEDAQVIIRGHLSSEPMLSIHPLQDYLAMDANLRRADFMEERVNDPSNPHHHWRYRLHFPVEQLCGPSAAQLRDMLRGMVTESAR